MLCQINLYKTNAACIIIESWYYDKLPIAKSINLPACLYINSNERIKHVTHFHTIYDGDRHQNTHHTIYVNIHARQIRYENKHFAFAPTYILNIELNFIRVNRIIIIESVKHPFYM